MAERKECAISCGACCVIPGEGDVDKIFREDIKILRVYVEDFGVCPFLGATGCEIEEIDRPTVCARCVCNLGVAAYRGLLEEGTIEDIRAKVRPMMKEKRDEADKEAMKRHGRLMKYRR